MGGEKMGDQAVAAEGAVGGGEFDVTAQRLEAGDPTVSIGIIASALWLINRDGELGNLAAPEQDQGALELNVRAAVELGQARAQASADARMRAASSNNSKKD